MTELKCLLLLALCAASCKTSSSNVASDQASNNKAPVAFNGDYTPALVKMVRLNPSTGTPAQNTAEMESACWKNPASKDLLDIQRTVYCYMPLDFRLCNTVVLLQTKSETKIDVSRRERAYDECVASSKLDKLLSDVDVRRAYIDLFVKAVVDLPKSTQDSLVQQFKPTLLPAEFDTLLPKMVSYYIKSHGGFDNAKEFLKTTLEPAAVENSQIKEALDNLPSDAKTFEAMISDLM